MALPKDFMQPNVFGVRGGVEPAFMSTTLERSVAMGYAAGDGTRTGVVLEARQGMVNRGAELSWLSQYPHEREILFAPLTGVEVLGVRVEGSVVVIECEFSINLTALTLEEVVSKRRALVRQICDELRDKAQRQLESSPAEWAALLEVVPNAVDAGLEVMRHALADVTDNTAEWYNDDQQLAQAIEAAVAAVNAVRGWPAGLEAVRRAWAKQSGGSGTLAELMRLEELNLDGERLRMQGAHGASALLSLSRSLRRLNLEMNHLGEAGARSVAGALARNTTLQELNLDFNEINDAGGRDIARALRSNTALRTLHLYSDFIYEEVAGLLRSNAHAELELHMRR